MAANSVVKELKTAAVVEMDARASPIKWLSTAVTSVGGGAKLEVLLPKLYLLTPENCLLICFHS